MAPSLAIIVKLSVYRNELQLMLLMTNIPISIYLHIPFCTTKCTYCAFNTYTHLEALIPAFVEALIREIEIVADGAAVGLAGERLTAHSVFFGGGTPTLLTPAQLGQILDTLHKRFEITPNAEITTEANPNDLDLPYLQGLRAAGFNRLSIGMQSANAQELKLFARRHDYETVIAMMPLVRQAHFENVNLDLIYGAPYQSLATWRDTLTRTLELAPEHVSLYALGLEDDTPLKEWVESGRVPTPDDDLAADMYEVATELLGVGGISNMRSAIGVSRVMRRVITCNIGVIGLISAWDPAHMGTRTESDMRRSYPRNVTSRPYNPLWIGCIRFHRLRRQWMKYRWIGKMRSPRR